MEWDGALAGLLRRAAGNRPEGGRSWSTLLSSRGQRRHRGRRLARQLEDALDSGGMRPRLGDQVEVRHFTGRWGNSYTMVANPRGPVYYRLSAQDGELLNHFDGSRTVRQIVVDRLQESEELDAEAVTDLAETLRRGGFLQRPWTDVYRAVRGRIERHGWLRKSWELLKTQTLQFQADSLAERAYRRGGRFAFTWPAHAVFLTLMFAGMVAFVLTVRGGRFDLIGHSLVAGYGLLFAFSLLETLIHESGHALAIKHARRKVLGAGFQLYLGHPAFFIDSADILMAPPRDRIRNAWFGPYFSFVVAGFSALVVFLFPASALSPLLFRFTVITYLTVFQNLVPFLELDGYWILTDLLQTTDLRPRALSFLRHELPSRLRLRQPLSRYEWALSTFGVLGAIFTVLAFWTSFWFWGPIFGGFIGAMWRGGLLGRVLLALLAALVLGPSMLGVVKLGRWVGGHLRAVIDQLRFRFETGWRQEAGAMISELPLLRELPLEALNELAGRVDLLSYAAGQPVVRQGERANAFFVVRRGRLEVVDEAGGQRVLRHLGPGDSFGELGLTVGSTRTATVRALRRSQLFRVDKGSFDRLLADGLVTPAWTASATSLEELRSLRPFAHLEPAQLSSVLARGSWQRIGPQEEVVTQGQRGEEFFVVGSGQVSVERDGQVVASLRAGDFFGELALLHDVPRTATVRTSTPVRLFRLDRPAFDELVADSFRRGAVASLGQVERQEER